jgi:DNA polymerase III subunit chi
MLNLAQSKPPSFSSFERLVEFVPIDGAALFSARERYKFYKDRGYPIKTHEYRELSQ